MRKPKSAEPRSSAQTHRLAVEDVRRELSDGEYQAFKEKIDRAERILEEVKSVLPHIPLLHNGTLSAGTIDYAAFRVETLSLIFEGVQQTLQKKWDSPELAYRQFLTELGDEVGLTFARELIDRLIERDLFLGFQDPRKILELWASFENDTGAGETKIQHYSPEKITIRLKKNPLRRVETNLHAHCGFYKSYLTSLINEICSIRARFLRDHVEGANVQAQCVFKVTEQPDADDNCVFYIQCRPEKLTGAFDRMKRAYDQFYRIERDQDFSSCMNEARGALVRAQMEAIGVGLDEAPSQLYLVYKGILDAHLFKDMNDAYQRTSKTLHRESKDSAKIDQRYAWRLLRDVRRSLYTLELLDFDDAKKSALQNQAIKLSRLAAIEEIAEKTQGLSAKDKHDLKELLSNLRKGTALTEERQHVLVSVLRKVGEKAWDIARPVLSETLTAAIKAQFGLE